MQDAPTVGHELRRLLGRHRLLVRHRARRYQAIHALIGHRHHHTLRLPKVLNTIELQRISISWVCHQEISTSSALQFEELQAELNVQHRLGFILLELQAPNLTMDMNDPTAGHEKTSCKAEIQ